MIDAVEFKKVVESYYNDFTQRYWDEEEGFKWKAVKAFSEKWDIDSSDFSAMLKAALKEAKPLLMVPNYFSSGMIGEFADAEPETVRQMFRDLYDESAELAWRFDNFKKQSIKLLSIIGKADKNHYQDEHAKPKEDEDGFGLEPGLFKEFCETAEYEPDKPYFLIIDEINRGNLSKIFGELLMLIEAGYRGQKLKLAYSKQEFSVPENLYIIGMMNTADRSLAMIDYALRRRFSFIDMEPGFDTDGFKARAKAYNNPAFDELIRVISGTDGLNAAIAGDPTLGKGFCIGHSYFVLGDNEPCSDELLCDIVNYDILPMLQEYWFDDAKKYQEWADKLHKAVNDGIE